MARRVTNREAKEHIAKRETFTNATRRSDDPTRRPGSFRGVKWFEGRGHLPEQFVDANLVGARYIVYSYDTPLAWWGGEKGEERWYYASVGYSPTTSRHQHEVRVALAGEDIIYVGGDWKAVPSAGKFWDGSPKVNASTGAPDGYYQNRGA